MIELITGLPGNGKTLRTIATTRAQAIAENRPVFYHGIADLNIPGWELLDDPKKWATCPPRSIILLDEAQKTFRNRSLGSQPPDYVTELETHRHLGIDLKMITQHPSLIDPAVRRLAGKHIHMVRIWGMEASTVHEWASVKDNCDKSRADSQSSKWGFDKSIYGLYKSAEVHTMKRSIPMRVKLLLCVPVLLAAGAWYVVKFVGKKPPVQQVATVSTISGQVATPAGPQAARFDPVSDARQYVAMNTPRVVGLAQTAPKYDELTKPVRVPVPAACIQRNSKSSCKCYSQQGTPMDVEYNMCIGFAQNGFFQEFDPEKEHKEQAVAARSQAVLSSRPDSPIPSHEPAVLSFAPQPEDAGRVVAPPKAGKG